MDDDTAYYEDDDDECFDEQQTEMGRRGKRRSTWTRVKMEVMQSARSVYMRFFSNAMELILCL
jgi:hypothetical protein